MRCRAMQEFLWLNHTLKNVGAKHPLVAYMSGAGYPVQRRKDGFWTKQWEAWTNEFVCANSSRGWATEATRGTTLARLFQRCTAKAALQAARTQVSGCDMSRRREEKHLGDCPRGTHAHMVAVKGCGNGRDKACHECCAEGGRADELHE